MNETKTGATVRKSARRQFTFLALCLLVLLGFLFRDGFPHDRTVFSNDGPLSAISARSTDMPSGFFGFWQDLNWLGGAGPSASPGISATLATVVGKLLYSKLFAPFALFVVGLSAWFCFRQWRLAPLACVLGGLAATLNSDFLSTACWGVAAQPLSFGLNFLALAALADQTGPKRWVRVVLAGFATGLGVMEAYDIGGIFSMALGAFVLFQALTGEGEAGNPKSEIRNPKLPQKDTKFPKEGKTMGAKSWEAEGGNPKQTQMGENRENGTIGTGEPARSTHTVWGRVVPRLAQGVGRLAVVVAVAVFTASAALSTLVGTQIKGVAGMEQDAATKARRWDEATQWSLPKIETLTLFVPGLFGFRMDTPKDLAGFQDWYQGGVYWGAVGRSPAWDRYFEGGKQGRPPAAPIRYSGGGPYAGVLVVLVALWAVVQSFRKENSGFSPAQRRFVWFWTGAAFFALLLAFGRFAPFFQLFYALPYASTMRNPAKFVHVVEWALLFLFAHGLHGLSRRYLEPATGVVRDLPSQFKAWWGKASASEKKWVKGSGIALVASLLAWLVYASSSEKLAAHLQEVGYDPTMSNAIAHFSIGQAGWFILFLALSLAMVTLVLSGYFAGPRAKTGGVLLGLLLVTDLMRADLPWVITQDWKQKYATNPVIEFLRDKPYEHRVVALPFQAPPQLQQLDSVYRYEWSQHHFQYYNIQSFDVVQNPRAAVQYIAFESALQFDPRNTNTLYKIVRRWQLTNTRYLLGATGFLNLLNQQLDPVQHRFRVAAAFDFAAKPGIANPTRLEEITAELKPDGQYAVFEFTGALPRAKLYANWQVSTNDEATLNQLASPEFDPAQTVLVAEKLPAPSIAGAAGKDAGAPREAGTVEFASYAPKDIVLRAKASVPSVLLLNDKHDPNWKVLVDGKAAELLRCNYIMRGVYLAAGAHTVEFLFKPPVTMFYVSLVADLLGLGLVGYLAVSGRREVES